MAFPINPDPKCFEKPAGLKPGHGITVEDDGHVYGYLTVWNARLIGSGRKNTKPPKSRNGYRYANAFNTKCSDDSIVRTGVIAGAGGHHFMGTFEASQKAYADVDTKIARVVYGEDKHGVWFTGALCSGVDEETVETIRSSGISGHWERPAQGGPLELLGSCLVNIPGFAQAADHRIAAAASFTPTGGIVLTDALDDTNPGSPGDVDLSSVFGAGNRITAAAGVLVPVSGVLAALGTPTVDGRQVNDVSWDRLPQPLWYLDHQNCWGHEDAVIVGRIDEIVKDGALVRFTGVIEQGLEGSASAEAVANLNVLGISMDGVPAADVEVEYEFDEYGWPTKVTFPLYEIHGGTLTSMPAFHETLGVQVGGTAEVAPVGEEPVEDEVPVEDDTETEDSVAASAGPGYTTIKLPNPRH